MEDKKYVNYTAGGTPNPDMSPDPSTTPEIDPSPSPVTIMNISGSTVPPTEIPGGVKEEGGATGWLWAIFIVLFVLLAAAAAVLIYVKVRSSDNNGGRRAPRKAAKRPSKRKADHNSVTEALDDTFMEGAEVDPDAYGDYGRPNTSQVTESEYAQAAQYMPRYAVGVGQTIGRRGNQEDSFAWSNPQYADERGLLAVVADGVGGLNNGQVASNLAVRVMCGGFDRQAPNRDMSSRLLELAAMAQNEVLRVNRQGERCGSTLVSVLIQNDAMVLLSIGDSRIALYRAGVLMPLNREHVLGKEIDETSALTNTESNDTRKRTAITAYVGKENLKLIDRTITPMQLVTGDRILLMSDGVFGTVGDDIICDALSRYDVENAAKVIIQAVDDRGLPHQDNATVVIVGVN